MKKINKILSVLSGLTICSASLVSCAFGPNEIAIEDCTVTTNQCLDLNVDFSNREEEVTYEYAGQNILIRDNHVQGMLAGTTTEVTASTASGGSDVFTVTVPSDTYSSTRFEETSEGWFDDITIEPIESLKDDDEFPLGIDISMVEQIMDCGGTFYNDDGVAQNVYQIIKDHGVNYVRIRLFNDPYNYYKDSNNQQCKVAYGAGICDLETVTKMAADAKAVGLKLLLDFHYSDFWADPAKQVMPKAWSTLTSSDAIAEALQKFTKDSIQTLVDAGAKPDMVQIGNEVTSGMLVHLPGGTNTTLTGGDPDYISDKTNAATNISGRNGYSNFIKYIKAGIAGVNEIDSNIKKMIQYAGGLSNTNTIIQFFNKFATADYDVVGLSYYNYYHGTIAQLNTLLPLLSRSFPDKLISIAENAYGFTYATDENVDNIFSVSGYAKVTDGYPCSVQGQANFVRDTINAVASIENGYGVFYWEGCWIPVAGAGWADANSKCSWGNQALFSYDGKALPSLDVFQAIKA